MTALVETRELVKTYELGGETVRAVDGVSLSIDHGSQWFREIDVHEYDRLS